MHNKPIGEYFFSDQGIRLQYLDSEIMACVINRLICDEEPLLPEHDSVIVRESIKDEVKQHMEEAYLEVMGSKVFCFGSPLVSPVHLQAAYGMHKHPYHIRTGYLSI